MDEREDNAEKGRRKKDYARQVRKPWLMGREGWSRGKRNKGKKQKMKKREREVSEEEKEREGETRKMILERKG